jgi:hypothetical protein
MPNATERASATALPIVIETIGEHGQRVERGFVWPAEVPSPFTPRPTPLVEVIVDLLSTLSAAAMLLAVGFVVGAMWRAGL